jgi:hypothetical protein
MRDRQNADKLCFVSIGIGSLELRNKDLCNITPKASINFHPVSVMKIGVISTISGKLRVKI